MNETSAIDITGGSPVVETPTDVFRRRVALWVLLGSGVIFLAVIIISSWVLLGGKSDSVNAAQAVLTTSIGFIGGITTSVVNFFFLRSD